MAMGLIRLTPLLSLKRVRAHSNFELLTTLQFFNPYIPESVKHNIFGLTRTNNTCALSETDYLNMNLLT